MSCNSVQKDTNLSKALSWILRHGAVSEGLAVSEEGFVKIDDLLKHRNFRGKYTSLDVLKVTETNDKQRFQIRKSSNGVLEIRACQGHSLRVVGNSGLTAITEHSNYPDVIHGTYLKHWPSIQANGLSRIKRNHIHFATGLPRHGKVISGCRSDSQIFIYVDLEKSLNDGIPFFLSENGVVLTPGNNEGILDVQYFKRVSTDKGFSDSITFQQLREYFGKIAEIYAYTDKTERNFSLISFENVDVVNKVLNMNHVINGRPVRVTRKNGRMEQRLSVSTASIDSNKQETKGAATVKALFDSKVLESKGNFNDQLLYLISRVRLKPEQVKRMAQLCTDLENDLGLIFPGCRARPFGSMVTGLGTIDSDVDCFIEFSGNFMPEDTPEDRITLQRQYIKKAKSVLYRYHRTYANICAIPRASTPIIKFFHIPTQTNCDINFKDCIGVMNSDLIRFLLSFDERLLPLFVFLKYLLKYYEINGRFQFTNYALTMMTFFYLQQPPRIIPPIHELQKNRNFENIQDLWNCGFERIEIPQNDNKLSITELLEGFFKFYKEFDFKNYVISPYVGVAVHESKFTSLDLPPELDLYKKNLDFDKPKINCKYITVQDPFRLCHNTTSAVSSKSLNEFVLICESASAICAKAHTTNTTNTLIKNLLDISVASTRGPRVAIKLPYALPHPEPVGLAAVAQLNALSEKMKEFVRSALSKILTCTIREEEAEGRRMSYYCELNYPIWENRERFPELNQNKNVLEKNIAISEGIVSSTEKSELLFNFYLDFQIKERPKVILLHILPGPKQNVNNYGEFVNFCQRNIIRWYDKFMSLNATKPNYDSNKSLKRSIEPIEVMSSEEDKKPSEPKDEKSRGDSPPEKVTKISIDANSTD